MTMGTNWNQPDILSGGPILDLDKVNQRKLVWFILVQLGSLCEGAKCIIQECLSLILVSVLVGFITRVLEGDPLTSSMGMFGVIFYCNKQCIDVVSLYHWNFHRLKYFYSYIRNGAGVIDLAIEEVSYFQSMYRSH